MPMIGYIGALWPETGRWSYEAGGAGAMLTGGGNRPYHGTAGRSTCGPGTGVRFWGFQATTICPDFLQRDFPFALALEANPLYGQTGLYGAKRCSGEHIHINVVKAELCQDGRKINLFSPADYWLRIFSE